MSRSAHAQLLNAGGELIAEGPCDFDELRGIVIFEPEREPGVLEKERGDLGLILDSGEELRVSDLPMVHRLRTPGNGTNGDGRLVRYRLRVLGQPSPSGVAPEVQRAQEATAAGAAGEGAPAPPSVGPEAARETPAAY